MDIEDDSILRHLLSKQITHLHIDISTAEGTNCWHLVSNIFTIVLSLCERLVELEFSQYIDEVTQTTPQCYLIRSNFLSSTLTKLKINVANIYDCLLLLDGRLEYLSILIINVADIFDVLVDIDPQVS